MNDQEQKKSVGRPRKFANDAERQKAHRERQKAAGLREIKTMVRDVRPGKKLQSNIIDLSEVRNFKTEGK